MKVLIIMKGFFPGRKYGGPPVSVNNFCSLMKDELECYIVTRNHDLWEHKPYKEIRKGWNNRKNAKVLYLTDREYGYKHFRKIINEIRPDIIYLQSMFETCVLPCLFIAKKMGIKVILAPRGELCEGAFKKKYKKLPYLKLLKLLRLTDNISWQSTSVEESESIIKHLSVKANNIHLLSNIPTIPAYLSPRQIKQKGEGRFVYLSRIVRKKNLHQALSFFRGVKGDVIYDIYGPKQDESYWAECETIINGLPDNIKVQYKGLVEHDEIFNVFCKYDAFLFPTLSENYGHVIAESLAAGCVPIISDQTPWSDMNDSDAGWAFELSKPERFKSAIQHVIDMNNDSIETLRACIKVYLNKKSNIEKIKTQYSNLFQI